MSYFKFDYKDPTEMGPKTVLLTPGEASFKVVSVFDTKKDGSPLTTMDGTPKLTVSMSVIDAQGNQSLVYDDLTPKTAWKIKTLLDAIGSSELYTEAGNLNPDDLIGGVGKCVIENKTYNETERSSIKKYVKAKVQADKVDYSDQLPVDTIPF